VLIRKLADSHAVPLIEYHIDRAGAYGSHHRAVSRPPDRRRAPADAAANPDVVTAYLGAERIIPPRRRPM
jgi:hypothetical protein